MEVEGDGLDKSVHPSCFCSPGMQFLKFRAEKAVANLFLDVVKVVVQ